MKKLLLAFLLLIGINFCSKAQWVSIPDTNFGIWLNTNGYSSCLQGNSQVGWQMDTTCPVISTTGNAWCNNSNIKDLTGIQYFDSLQNLLCAGNQLTSLPPLPKRLGSLFCHANQLTSLPALPNSLKYLLCDDNQLTSLPALPNGLIDLRCALNQLTALPSLPNSLTTLMCYDNQLSILPTLPNSLRGLDCSNNLLSILPALPDSLAGLTCNNNQLSNLPELPDSLNYCRIQNNPLTCLPQLKRIVNLDFSNTAITCLPNYGNVTNSNPSLQSLPLCQPGNVNGCAWDTLMAHAGGDTTISTGNDVVLGGNPTATGGTPPYIYFWTGISLSCDTCPNPVSQNLPEGSYTYTVTVMDSLGALATDNVIVFVNAFVWPGDADNNGLADNSDLLPIGLGYGTAGPARAQQDINWYAHTATNWIDTLPSATNYKHIDCNGNGTINADDTLAILQNFGQTHAKTNDRIDGWRMIDPALYVDLNPDTTRAGDTMYANIILGDVNLPASNIYGLAFTINYDALVVDSTKTRLTFSSSWLGNATDKISIAKDFAPVGQLKCALTRIDHTTRSGFGQIGQAAFVITTDNINGKDLAYHQMDVWISDLRVIDNLGNLISVNAGYDSSLVEFEPIEVGIPEYAQSAIRIMPNPANDEVQLIITEDFLGGELKLLDIEGRLVISMPLQTTNHKLQTTNLYPGIYFIRAIAEKGMLTTRLVIAR
jgi:hypothetical protein